MRKGSMARKCQLVDIPFAPWCKTDRQIKMSAVLDDSVQRVVMFAWKISVNFGLISARANRVTKAVLRETIGEHFFGYLHTETIGCHLLKTSCTMVQEPLLPVGAWVTYGRFQPRASARVRPQPAR
jgi:hypothetical protein